MATFNETERQELTRRLEEIDYAMAHRDDEDFVELALVNAHHSLRRVLGMEQESTDRAERLRKKRAAKWPARSGVHYHIGSDTELRGPDCSECR